MQSKHDSYKLQPISDEIVLAQPEDILLLALMVNRIFKYKTNVSNKYVYTIHSLKLRPLHIVHISPRILQQNIQHFVLYNFYRQM